MRAFVGITDNDWFDFLRRQDGLTEVNFWQPSGGRQFRALDPGQPLLFKLHAPHNVIAGGGFLATFSILPLSLAWETFGIANGAPSRDIMRERIERYRRVPADPKADYSIGVHHPRRALLPRGARLDTGTGGFLTAHAGW